MQHKWASFNFIKGSRVSCYWIIVINLMDVLRSPRNFMVLWDLHWVIKLLKIRIEVADEHHLYKYLALYARHFHFFLQIQTFTKNNLIFLMQLIFLSRCFGDIFLYALFQLIFSSTFESLFCLKFPYLPRKAAWRHFESYL